MFYGSCFCVAEPLRPSYTIDLWLYTYQLQAPSPHLGMIWRNGSGFAQPRIPHMWGNSGDLLTNVAKPKNINIIIALTHM